jgi:hypothetical protein
VRGELQPVLDGGFDDGPQPFLGNEQHAAIIRVGNRIRLAHTPRLPQIGAARQHAAVQIRLDADDAQQRIFLAEQPMLRHAPDAGLNFGERPRRIDVMRDRHPHGQSALRAQLLVERQHLGIRVAVANARDAD